MVKVRFEHVWTPQGWVRDRVLAARDGVIRGVFEPASDERTKRQGSYVLPGLTSLHSHAFQRGMAGLAETRGAGPESFWTWREVMYGFLDRLIPDDVRDIAAMAYVEMAERGFTSVVEFHYLHHDIDGRPYANRAAMAEAIVEAARESGIGLTLLPTLYRFGGFGSAAPGHGQRRFINTPDDFEALVNASAHAVKAHDDARLGIALHSLRAVAPEDIARAMRLIDGAPLHIHAAEQEKEVTDCIAWSGKRPVRWLLDTVGLDARWCVIHATHMDAGETRDLARSGAVAGLCPVTEANLGDGIFPATDYLEAGGAFGVGTDSNVLISAAEELRTLEYGQRLRDRQRVRLAAPGQSVGERLYAEALAGGAQASGRRIGRLEAGARADWIVLDETDPMLAFADTETTLDRVLFSGPTLPIKDVWIGGQRVVRHGRHVKRDAIGRRFIATMQRLTSG